MDSAKKNFIVHISEIPHGVSENDIKKYFKDRMGIDVKIGHLRPVKNKEIPLQWARVDLWSFENYERAVEEQRFPTFLEGHQSRLLPNDRDIISKDIAEKNIFVKGLDKVKYDNEELYELFKQFGAIDASKISKTVKSEGGNIISTSNGYGFVKFNDADKAKEVLENTKFDDEGIVLESYMKDRKKPDSNNLYVKNFENSVTEDTLREIFSKYGDITSVKVMQDEASGRKFGYVCFKEEDAAKAALEMHESAIPPHSDSLYVQKHVKKSVRRDLLQKAYKKQNLFVRNFGENVTEKDLKDLFNQFGSIMNVKILTKNTVINGEEVTISQSKGFVWFESPEDARAAVDYAQDKGIWFDSKRLNVSLFEPKSERANQGRDSKMGGVNPEISDFIAQFLQNMAQGQMPGVGGFMGGAGGPPMPPAPMGPARSGYGGQTQKRMPRNDMYGNRPPQPVMPTSNYGAPPMPRPPFQQQPMMMSGGNQFPPGPPQNMPRNVPMMQPEMQMEAMDVMQPQPTPGMEYGAPVMQPPVNFSSDEAQYNNTYNEMIKSHEYATASEDDKRTKFGDLIFPYVEGLSGPDNAPKITGMIIDLELNDLEQATSTLSSLKEKISEGMDLLADEGGD